MTGIIPTIIETLPGRPHVTSVTGGERNAIIDFDNNVRFHARLDDTYPKTVVFEIFDFDSDIWKLAQMPSDDGWYDFRSSDPRDDMDGFYRELSRCADIDHWDGTHEDEWEYAGDEPTDESDE